jgi:two-component system sensor histidine kinase CpxA
MIRAGEPPQYWVGVRLPPPDRRTARGPVTVLIVSDSLRGGGLFFDATPWVLGALGVLGFTALFWFPFVRGITAVIGRMTRATEQIAAGQFDVRLGDRRADELGRLSEAINRMAGRLAGYVTGQKRFLGDIAHELCSPLARIQMALGILEQRADDRQRAHVEGVREEVQHMSRLVAELLSFSRASLKPQEVRLRAVNLAEIARRVVTREAADTSPVTLNVPEDLAAQAEPELLTRALANVLRNAIRYAGHAGPITLSARREDDRVVLQVADAGPGVPDKAIGQLFQPFYRPDAARGRDTGGAGLGLAIVKSCVDACQGTVACRNLAPSGFAVEISLQACAPQAA